MCCKKEDWIPGTTRLWKDCGYPYQRYDCVNFTCVERCGVIARGLPPGKSVVPTSSARKQQNGAPQKFECCIRPDTVPDDGECVPNCQYGYRFGLARGPKQCGNECCLSYERCVNGRCEACDNTCQSAQGGHVRCCPDRTDCCFNNTSTACCGPEQTCRAHGVRRATCVCTTGAKCGPHCCAKGEKCCGNKTCCGPGETCLGTSCCPTTKLCGPSRKTCCGDGEFCFWKAEVDPTTGDVLRPLGGTCKRGCAAGNQAGSQCCGTGYRPNRNRSACEAVAP